MNITQLEEIILDQAETFQKKQRGVPRDIPFGKGDYYHINFDRTIFQD